MYLFNLGNVDWQTSQAVYHTLARMGVDALVVCSPKQQYVCLGYFQDAEKEVDVKYLNTHNIPLIRREVGGGAVLLDNNQIFYHVIWNRDNGKFPLKFSEIYQLLSQAPISTYNEFGVKTEFREVNDILTYEGKKIAGLGGANIENSMVFVGSIILDFDYETMAKTLKVPDEKFRDKVFKNLKDYVSSIKREIGEIPKRKDVIGSLIKNFEGITGKLKPINLNKDVIERMEQVSGYLMSPDFIYKKTPKKPDRVKIKSGVEMLYTSYKAKGGLIRTSQEIMEDIINDLIISGDFTMNPKEGLDIIQRGVVNSEREKDEVLSRVGDAYDKGKIDVPGVSPEDVAEAITKEIKKG